MLLWSLNRAQLNQPGNCLSERPKGVTRMTAYFGQERASNPKLSLSFLKEDPNTDLLVTPSNCPNLELTVFSSAFLKVIMERLQRMKSRLSLISTSKPDLSD